MFVRISVLLLCVGLASCSTYDVVYFGTGVAKDATQFSHDPGPAPITTNEEGSSSGNTGGPWDEDKTKKP